MLMPQTAFDDLVPRHLKAELLLALAAAKVLNLIGPRQAGKTTLVRDLLEHGTFITLDDDSIFSAIEADPLGQLQILIAKADGGPAVIDEAQRAPRLALAIKKLADERRAMGQFILTGSSNIFTSAAVADSLAGRVETLTLFPLSAAELHRAGPNRILDYAASGWIADLPPPRAMPRDAVLDMILRGGYPGIMTLDERARQRRYRSYVDSIVDRDVAAISNVRKTDALRRLIHQLAARNGQELNIVDLSGAVGVQRPTAETYIDVLEKLSMIRRLGAWASGEARREIRHPKLHFLDTGLVAALRNLSPASFAIDAGPAALGGIFETFVHAEIVKSLPFQAANWRLFHWRGEKTREIDLVAEAAPRTLVAFECKAAMTVREEDFKHLRWFASAGPGKSWEMTGIVVYLGEQLLSFGGGMYAVPVSAFWSFPAEEAQPPRSRKRGRPRI
jgi:predicted AAA+ superfamily ATPase